MGMDARKVGRLSLWQFNAMCAGWQKANEAPSESAPPPTYEEFKHFMDAPVGGYRN